MYVFKIFFNLITKLILLTLKDIYFLDYICFSSVLEIRSDFKNTFYISRFVYF